MKLKTFLTLSIISLISLNAFSATSGHVEVSASSSNLETTELKKETPSDEQVTEIITTETAEGKTDTVKWVKVTSKNKQTVTKTTPNETETIIGFEDTQQWSLKSNKKTMSVIVKSKKATIEVIKNDEKTTTDFKLGNEPILYPPSFFLKSFIKSNTKKMSAWSINRKNEKLRKMLFTKVGNETISIQNKKYDCIKIEMKPTGVAGMIWKAYYWFEVPSGKFIKYFGKKGPPGTPDYTIEISELPH